MITSQTLITIALLCQTTGTHGGSNYNYATFNAVKNAQKNCQRLLVECVEKKKITICIKEGNY